MAENKKTEFTDEVNSRLGEFFGDQDTSGTTPLEATSGPSKDSVFVDLKAIVLSIEWEITDQTMEHLIAETDRLMKIYPNNKVVLALLKLLGSIGKYINTKKVNAHPDSIQLLHSVHANLQKVGTSNTITEAQSNKILAGEVVKFRRLKQQLATQVQAPAKADQKPIVKTETAQIEKEAMPREPKPPTAIPQVDAAPQDPLTTGGQEAVLHAIEDLKVVIRKELQALREELKLLKQQQS